MKVSLSFIKIVLNINCFFSSQVESPGLDDNHHTCILANIEKYFGIATLVSDSWLLTHAETIPNGRSRYAYCKGQIRHWNYWDVHYLTLDNSDEELALIRVTEAFQLNSWVFPTNLPAPGLKSDNVSLLHLYWDWEAVQYVPQEPIKEQDVSEESQQEGSGDTPQDENVQEVSLQSHADSFCGWVDNELSAGNSTKLDDVVCRLVPLHGNICESGHAVPVLGSLSDGSKVLVAIIKYLNVCTEPGHIPARGFVRVSDFVPLIQSVLSVEQFRA